MARNFRLLLRSLVLLMVGYIAFCGLVAYQKESLLYPSDGRARAAGRTAPPGYETWWLPLPENAGRVEAWWRPARNASEAMPAPVVIYFHGNAELIDDQRAIADLWHGLGVSVLLCEHTGYGRSGGLPSLEADISNAVAWFDRVAARPDVRVDAILAHGFSLGGAFAAQLAARRPVAGLALESTFSNLPSMARGMNVWIYFPRERLDTLRILGELPEALPVLITHGRQDRVIPVTQGRALAAARPEARYVEGDFPHVPWAQDEPGQMLLSELLAQVIARSEPPAPMAR
ncbi:MAG: alpha/beta hydrolase [Verrucomicrobia bacterium]|nr:MAG: alpha/beta hydrolase [Verrucomicrobiota bacterium]